MEELATLVFFLAAGAGYGRQHMIGKEPEGEGVDTVA
jgi:hypothetical protein